jgi:uncharacterized damage-inducible protein DinB
MADSIVETWQIHDRINRYLLEAIPEEALSAFLTPKFRSVFKIFAHIHNVRLMWLKASAPELLDGVVKIDADTGSKVELDEALKASGLSIGQLLEKAVAAGGKIKGFKPHSTAFLGYLISHESHHRGQIGWTLKGAGLPLDKKVAFGLWEWGVR